MMFSKRDQTILAVLRKVKPLYRDLGEVLDFYENLFQVQFVFKCQLGASDKAAYFGNREINLDNLAKGLPQITFEELDMGTTPFLDLYRSIFNLLIPYTG